MSTKFQQNSFEGGMDTLSDPVKIAANSYEFLFNGRSRFSYIEAIKKPRELTTAPAGLKQGLYGIGDTLVLFVSGKAYYYDKAFDVWQQIVNFQMSAHVDIIYTQLVNASSAAHIRKMNPSGSNNDRILKTYDFAISGNPAGLVCQDGINQPWLIQLNQNTNTFVARQCKTYTQWANVSMTADDREYVPIGKQMMYANSILFIVAPNGKSIYRSVSGRPLDFMVNVDVDGNKISSELTGGATSVNFALDFDEITAISELGAEAFIVGSRHNVRIVQYDYTNTIFGEPTFTYATTMQFGIVNQFSISQFKDVISIDFENITSFNAVSQLKFEGRNSRFSLNISSFLKGIRQDVCCVTEFDNYLHFAAKTTMGYCVFIYDHLIDEWQAIDVTEASKIKMFASLVTDTAATLYCISNSKVFHYYGSTTTAPCSAKFRTIAPESLAVEHGSNDFRVVFNGCKEAGTCIARETVDGERNGSNTNGVTFYERDIPIANLGINYPVIPPVIPDNNAAIVSLVFPFKDWITGRRIAYILTWNNSAQLKEIEISTDATTKAVSQRQASKVYN